MNAKRLGNLYNMGTSFAGNVYDKDFIAPTLMNMQGGGRQPMIVIKANKIGATPQENSMELRQRFYAALDEQNKCLRFDTFGCLTTDGSSPKHNNRVVEFYES